MDLMQFLVVAGFTDDWKPLYTDQGRRLLPNLTDAYESRRATLPHRNKVIETKIVQLFGYYYEHSGEHGFPAIRTIRDLQSLIGKTGKGKINAPNLGVVTFAYLNLALHHFGVTGIKFHVSSREASIVGAVPNYIPFT